MVWFDEDGDGDFLGCEAEVAGFGFAVSCPFFFWQALGWMCVYVFILFKKRAMIRV